MIYTIATLSTMVDGRETEIQTTKQELTQLTTRVAGLETKMDTQF